MTVDAATWKQPYEEFPVDLNFAPRLAVGETIDPGPTVTARNAESGADTSGAFLAGSPTVSGSKVVQKCRAGAAGERHIVTVRIVTSNANKYEGEIAVDVVEH